MHAKRAPGKGLQAFTGLLYTLLGRRGTGGRGRAGGLEEGGGGGGFAGGARAADFPLFDGARLQRKMSNVSVFDRLVITVINCTTTRPRRLSRGSRVARTDTDERTCSDRSKRERVELGVEG